MDSELNMIQQYALAAMKANSILGSNNCSTASRLREVIIFCYSAHTRLHLEYCVQFWVPLIKRVVEKLEKATKMVWSLRNINTNRLRELVSWFQLG